MISPKQPRKETAHIQTPRPWLPVLIWFSVSLVLFLAGNSGHSLWDRDESRFAEAARYMQQSGDWIVPQFNGKIRPDKPVFIYWLMATAMQLFGPNEFAARLPAAVSGAATVAVMFVFARRLGASVAGAHVAATLMCLSPLHIILAKSSTTDALLCLTVVSALLLHWEQITRGFTWSRHLAFWTIVSISALTKGPPGLMVIFLTIVTLAAWNRWHPIKPFRNDVLTAVKRTATGLVLFLVLSLPWAIAAWRQTDGKFFEVAVGHHVIARATKSLEGHSGPFLFYLPVLLIGTFPAAALYFRALPSVWIESGREQIRLLIAWLIPSLLVFSCVKTKLPHYMTPLIPAMAIAAALHWDRPEDQAGWSRTKRFSRAAGVALNLILFCGFGVAAFVASWLSGAPALRLPAIFLGSICIAGGIASTFLYMRQRLQNAFVTGTSCALAAYLVAFIWLLPTIELLRPSKQIASWIRDNAPPGTKVVAAQYQEPSLVFYWGGHVIMRNSRVDTIKELLDPKQPTALVVPEKDWLKWKPKVAATLPTNIYPRFTRKFLVPQAGEWRTLMVVGNW